MSSRRDLCLFVSALIVTVPLLRAEMKAPNVEHQLRNLRSVLVDQRPATIIELAAEIRALPASSHKVGYADELAHLSTAGDVGRPALQAAADALTAALTEAPVPAKGDMVPTQYYDLARLVHYEQVTTTMTDPLFVKAVKILSENETALEKADFSLMNLSGQKTVLSEMRGRIVLVNFWATSCGQCQQEMKDLDAINRKFAPQGLAVVSITNEDRFKARSFLAPYKYSPTVLLDPGDKVHRQFHVTGVPTTFLFGRDGKLLAVAIDQRTRRQLLEMLAKTDLRL